MTASKAKVFGGGNVLQGFMLSNVGEQNAEFIVEYLNLERIPIAARDLLDVWPRKIYYFPRSGKVMVKRLRKVNNDTIVLRERDYGAQLFHGPIEGRAGALQMTAKIRVLIVDDSRMIRDVLHRDHQRSRATWKSWAPPPTPSRRAT